MIMINQADALKKTVEDMKAPPTGLWIAGKKYTVTRTDDKEECGEHTLKWVQANYPKHGVHLIQTKSQILVVFYSEEKGQTAGNAKKAAVDFAAYLVGEGY